MVTKGEGAGNHDEPLGKAAHEDTDGESVDGAFPEGGIKDPSEEKADADGDKVKGGGGKGG